MAGSLAKRFAASRGGPIDVDGRTVQLRYEHAYLPSCKLTIRLRSDVSRQQGLCVEAKGGNVEVGGQVAEGFTFWVDTAPPEIEVRLSAGVKPVVLRFWNTWHWGDAPPGTGSFGMRIVQADQETTLHCSDGWGPPSFDDLVVTIREQAT